MSFMCNYHCSVKDILQKHCSCTRTTRQLYNVQRRRLKSLKIATAIAAVWITV